MTIKTERLILREMTADGLKKIRNGTEYRRRDQAGNRLSYAEGYAAQGFCKGGGISGA